MKRRRSPRVSQAQANQQVAVLQQIIGGLVARLGCHVEMTKEELDPHEGDRMEMTMTPDGVTLTLHRKIRVVSSLN